MTETTWKPKISNKSERLFQITCVLLYSDRGLTKRELFHAIDDYREAANDTDGGFALNKKFERDKNELGKMGIWISNPDQKSDPDEMRYTIPTDTFNWPEGTKFNAQQLQLLNLAAQIWAQASLSSDANQGLMRLRGLGIEPAASNLIGFAPRLRTHEPSFLPLSQAIEQRIEVTFDYRDAKGEVSRRKVQPWLLRSIDGQWLLICWDKDRHATRNFLLRRIVSKIQFRTVEINENQFINFDEPASNLVEVAIAELTALIKTQIAKIRVEKNSQAWFRFHLDETESTEVEIAYMDIHLLAEELSEYALDIQVISPKELDQVIRSRFEAVVNAHA